MTENLDPRVEAGLPVRIWGMGADGQPFFQDVQAQDIGARGAQLCGIDHPLKVGDVIGVQFGEKKARSKVVWVIDAGQALKIQVGVEILEGQPCPWQDKLKKRAPMPAPVAQQVEASGDPKNKRKYERHKIAFPIEIQTSESTAIIRTQATDIGGRGCYVETMLPMAVGTALTITFWIDSDKVITDSLVRTCDGGVGMGIEFTGLKEADQQRLQGKLEEMDRGSSSSADAPGQN